MNLSLFKDKKVFIKTREGRSYTGKIQEVGENYVVIIDKFSRLVSFYDANISLIQEEV